MQKINSNIPCEVVESIKILKGIFIKQELVIQTNKSLFLIKFISYGQEYSIIIPVYNLNLIREYKSLKKEEEYVICVKEYRVNGSSRYKLMWISTVDNKYHQEYISSFLGVITH